MELKMEEIKSAYEYTEEYVRTKYNLYQLKTIKKSIDLTSYLTAKIFYLVLLCFSFLFLAIGLSLYLGELIGKPYAGFFVLSCVIFIFSVVFSFFGYRSIRRIISKILIHKVEISKL